MIMARTSHIHTVDDFYMNESGMILLDSVCMKLIAVGESVKNLDKITDKETFTKELKKLPVVKEDLSKKQKSFYNPLTNNIKCVIV